MGQKRGDTSDVFRLESALNSKNLRARLVTRPFSLCRGTHIINFTLSVTNMSELKKGRKGSARPANEIFPLTHAHFSDASPGRSQTQTPSLAVLPSPPPLRRAPNVMAEAPNPLHSPLSFLADISLAMTPPLAAMGRFPPTHEALQTQWAHMILQRAAAVQAMAAAAAVAAEVRKSPSPTMPWAPSMAPSPFFEPKKENFQEEQTAPEDLRIPAKRMPSADVASPLSYSEEDADSVDSSSSKKLVAGAFFPCPDCNKAYSTSSNLARHRQTHR